MAGWGKRRQWYLGKAAETREPETKHPHGCPSGPGGHRRWGLQGGRRSPSARSRAASSGRAPAAPAHHMQQWGPVRAWPRLQHSCGGQGVSLPDPFPCTWDGGRGMAGGPGGRPSLLLSPHAEPWGPSPPCAPSPRRLGWEALTQLDTSGKSPGSLGWVRPVPLPRPLGLWEPQRTGKIWKR